MLGRRGPKYKYEPLGKKYRRNYADERSIVNKRKTIALLVMVLFLGVAASVLVSGCEGISTSTEGAIY